MERVFCSEITSEIYYEICNVILTSVVLIIDWGSNISDFNNIDTLCYQAYKDGIIKSNICIKWGP